MKLGYTLMYVDNVKKTMDFYSKAFGLKIGFLHESHQYGEMLTGETKLGFVHHDTASSHGFRYKKSTDSDLPFGIEIGLITTYVEDSFDKAISEGAVEVQSPQKKPWGQTVSYVKDCNGFLIEICSPMA